jgi:hypothetical protein
MRKYLELFTNGFDETLADKIKPENRPYIGYSPSEGVKFTFIPKPAKEPANNEIWYTSSDGNIVTPDDTSVFGVNIIDNSYESGKGVITFDGDITSIGEWAFYNCYGLTSITIPNSVTSIGANAFQNCYNLTSITIPNSVTSIGYGAFYSCTSLTSITIPEGVTSIGDNAFVNCYRLISIVVEEGNTVYDSRENCNAIIETASNTLITGCKNTIIPNSVTSIEKCAFYDCYDLTSITIPEGVTSIGDDAFVNCTSLTSITIPHSVTSIGVDAFRGCEGLTSITIPNSITSIEEGTFYNCDGLTSITIPNSVTSIGKKVFVNCSSLNSITYEGTRAQWNAITKGTYWNNNVPATYVQCSDGQATL